MRKNENETKIAMGNLFFNYCINCNCYTLVDFGGALMKRKKFTLIELMFSVGILVILLSISWIAGNKALKSQAKKKIGAEIVAIESAINQYKDRFGSLPFTSDCVVDFGQYLSPVLPNGKYKDENNKPLNRPMFLDFKAMDLSVDNPKYSESSATKTTLLDPYDQPYKIKIVDGIFKVYSDNQ